MSDLTTMKNNAMTYNGPLHWVSNIAFKLETEAEAALNQRKDEIINLEHLIKERNR